MFQKLAASDFNCVGLSEMLFNSATSMTSLTLHQYTGEKVMNEFYVKYPFNVLTHHNQSCEGKI